MSRVQVDRPLHLALEVDGDGAHPAAWRASGRAPAAVLSPGAVRGVVRDAESAGFTLVTFADSPLPPNAGSDRAGSDRVGSGSAGLDSAGLDSAEVDAVGRLEAVGRAAYVSTLTDRIGLAPTAHAITTEPFHLATQLASLDYASRGRAAWLRTRATDGFNITPHLIPGSIEDVVDKVVPELQERGAYRAAYEGTTLREHLALLPLYQ